MANTTVTTSTRVRLIYSVQLEENDGVSRSSSTLLHHGVSVLRADQEAADGAAGPLLRREPGEVPRETLRDAGAHGKADSAADLLQLQTHRRLRRHQEIGKGEVLMPWFDSTGTAYHHGINMALNLYVLVAHWWLMDWAV